MSPYRHRLPQLSGPLFVTDGGLETTLIYHEHIELAHFAAFDLLRTAPGTATLRRYYERYAQLARAHGRGLVLEAPTWRANPDWAAKLGYDAPALADANRAAIGLMLGIRAAYETPESRMVISGNLGPRGDGYRDDLRMSADEARAYHQTQIDTFAGTDADMVADFTMNYVEEAIGIGLAARAAAMPVVLSFTLETDGRLPSGMPLGDAIARTDDATGGAALYYMINCAHPVHFEAVLADGAAAQSWCARIRGLRVNASKRSHAELDASTDLDAGDPAELAAGHRRLRALLPGLAVVGGCCGTDHRHVDAICAALSDAS
ncbi:MAG: homocysteine S-methyltransferase family protein [Steroidobacteraceae bacterium]|nr:homocysteine S-methyltransferase family protein [Steroidobacteraceae bacterium]